MAFKLKKESNFYFNEDNLKKLGQLILILLLVSFPLTIFFNLQRGLDLTDTGHYYNTITYFDIIESISTHFFLFFKLFPIPQGIYPARILVFCLFILSGITLSIGLSKIIQLSLNRKLDGLVFIIAVISSVFVFYHAWIPDPSYNSLGLIQLIFLVGLILLVVHRITINASIKTTIALCLVSGFFLAALGVSRPLSAILFITLTSIFYFLSVQKPYSRFTLMLFLTGIFGGLFFLGLSHIFVEPLSESLTRELSGLESRTIKGKNLILDSNLSQISYKIQKGLFEFKPYAFWSFLAVLGATLNLKRKPQVKNSLKIHHAISAVGIAGIALVFFNKLYNQEFASEAEVAIYLLVLTISIGFVAICNALNNFDGEFRDNRLSWLAILYLFILPYIFSIGTTNSIFTHTLLAGGFTIVANLILILKSNQYRNWKYSIPSYLALSLLFFSAFISFSNNPYRLPSPLSNQSEKIEIRNGEGGTLFVDMPTAEFMNAVGEFYPQLGEKDSRVYLVDLSGQLPFLHYHLDAKPLTVPWVNSGEKRAQVFFKHLLTRLPSAELKKAWVVDMPYFKRRLDSKELSKASGLNFPQDYELVLVTKSPRLKQIMHLYRPAQ